MAHNEYAVVLATLDGVPLAEVPAKNLQYSYTLNAPGSVYFTLPTLHGETTRKNLEPGQREIYIYRNGTKVWGGYLWQVAAEADVARVSGGGYLSKLARRYIDTNKTYTTTEQLDIAWDLIEYTQSKPYGGDMGFLRFSNIPSNIFRTVSYAANERKYILDAIKLMAEAKNGFDYEISEYKEWKTYYPEKGRVLSEGFEYGKNVSGIYIELDAGKVGGEVTGIGAGDGPSAITSVYADTGSLEDHGRLEFAFSEKDVKDQAELDALTQSMLAIRKASRLQPQLQVYTDDPPLGSYTTGDRVRVRAKHGFIDVDAYFRILSIVVAVANSGRDAIGVYFDEVGD